MKIHLPVAVLLLSTATINAQIDPTVSGDDLLCPNATGVLTTESYDNYQWLRRDFGTSTTYAISGENGQTLTVDYNNYAPSYISVAVNDNGIADTSAELLIDGWAFASPSVSTSGDFGTGPNNEAVLCTGDTLYLEFLSPYVTNITWFDGGSAIPGETNPVLEVTSAGSYTVQGAPAECPDYIVLQGVPVDVIMDNCGLGLDGLSALKSMIYPNPATSQLTVEGKELIVSATITNSLGQIVSTTAVLQLERTIDVSHLDAGIYFITIVYGNSSETQQFSVN